jgi:hypothetical protein
MKVQSLGFTDNFSKRKMWEEIAQEFNGEFRIAHDAGGALEIHRITIPYKKWKLSISVSDSRPLKFEISFSSSQDFELILSWEDFIEGIFKRFKKPEIELGWNEFDKRYLVKSNRSDLVKDILTRDVQEALLKHNIYSLSYQTKSESRTSELVSVIQRQVGEKQLILDLISMFEKLIDNLFSSRVIN